jgi:hypothetical protein
MAIKLNGNSYELKFTNRDLMQYQTETGKTLSTLMDSIRSLDIDALFTLVWLGVRHAIANVTREEVIDALPLVTSSEGLKDVLDSLVEALQLNPVEKKTETLTNS